MFCTNCGSRVPDQAKFCAVCGHQVGGAVAQSVSDQTQLRPARVDKVVGSAAYKLCEATGGTSHASPKFKGFFTNVCKKHNRTDAQELFVCGSPSTTSAVQSAPVVWAYPRVFVTTSYLDGQSLERFLSAVYRGEHA